MAKRLIVCFDGTWNTPDDGDDESTQVETNVRRLYEALTATAPDGATQRPWYDRGVGTDWYSHALGGGLGAGLSRNVRQGYHWLGDEYAAGDELFVFGFSRGAYTARSLVGLIRKCGLLRWPDSKQVEDAYDLYRTRDATPDSPQARSFRAAHSREVRLRFVGVWDTVGALGVPTGLAKKVPLLARLNDHWAFHDTGLSRIVDHAYHALALDEWREDYAATLWTGAPAPGQTVEQRWFPGAHSDVGGGYRERQLSDLALCWMVEKARACGVGFDAARLPACGDPLGTIHDSYSGFMKGLYAKGSPRFLRRVGAEPTETADDSLRRRLKDAAGYRPRNHDLAGLVGV